MDIQNKNRSSRPYSGAKVAQNLQISRSKVFGHLRNTPTIESYQTLHRLSLLSPHCISKIKGQVTSHQVHIGAAKVANIVIRNWKCHCGATYMDGMTGDPLVISDILHRRNKLHDLSTSSPAIISKCVLQRLGMQFITHLPTTEVFTLQKAHPAHTALYTGTSASF